MKPTIFLKKNASPILLGVGATSLIGAIFLMPPLVRRADKLIEERKPETVKDKLWVYIPVYTPVAGAVLFGIGAMVRSTQINKHQVAALNLLLSKSEESLVKLSEIAEAHVGKRKAEKIFTELSAPAEPPSPDRAATGEQLFFEVFGGRYFNETSIEKIRASVNDFNELVNGEGWGALNELYYSLGLDPVEYGDILGWSSEEILHVKFDSFLKAETPVVSVTFQPKPKEINSHG